MERRLSNLVKNIKKDSGDHPLVFLDTGAVIDFENELKLWRQNDKSRNSTQWYHLLSKDLPIFITEGAMSEVTKHHEHHKINGRPEISAETYDLVNKYHEDYCKFLKEISDPKRDLDQVRFDTYWASELSFREDYKKGVLDVISNIDRETVETAAWMRYVSNPKDKGVTSSIILSPDKHLDETVATLTDKNMVLTEIHGKFAYDNIKVLTSRY